MLSDEAESVTSVPDAFPANVPNACAVLQVGAEEAFIISLELIPAFPFGFSTLTL